MRHIKKMNVSYQQNEDLFASYPMHIDDVKKFKDNSADKYEAFIFVGGTGLYFNALLNGLSDIPAIETKIRKKSVQSRWNSTKASI